MQGSIGGRFPECLEEIVLGRVRENVDSEKRDTAIIKSVLKRLLIALKRLHSLGVNLVLAQIEQAESCKLVVALRALQNGRAFESVWCLCL